MRRARRPPARRTWLAAGVLLLLGVSCGETEKPTTPAAGNTAPRAAFTVTPAAGDLTTFFRFDASGSRDDQDSTAALLVRWDWEGDGIWDTPFSTTKFASHRYAAAGNPISRLEVRDRGNLTSTATETLHVAMPACKVRLFLAPGSVMNHAAIDSTDNHASVQAGDLLTGIVNIRTVNDHPGTDNVPLVYTPSWGSHSSSYRQVAAAVPAGTSLYSVTINMTAPIQPGAYYLTFGADAQTDPAFVASATSSSAGAPVWDDGNDLADLTETDMSTAPSEGCAVVRLYEGPGLLPEVPFGVNYVKLDVTPPAPCVDQVFLAAGGSLNGQPIDATHNEVAVASGDTIGGIVKLHTQNNDPPASNPPLVYTPSWGDHASSWRLVGTAPAGVPQDFDLPITSISPPAQDGVYYLTFGMSARSEGGRVASMTSDNCAANVWTDHNDLADLGASKMAGALAYGCLYLSVLECTHYAMEATGIAYITVRVNTPPACLVHLSLATGGTLNNQEVDGAHRTVTVASGVPITGTVNLHVDSAYGPGDVVPVVLAPSWGSHSGGFVSVAGSTPPGAHDDAIPVSMTAPVVPGTYLLILAAAAQANAQYVASVTDSDAGPPVWNDGNDLADLSETDLSGSISGGCALVRLYEGLNDHRIVPFGITYVKIEVGR